MFFYEQLLSEHHLLIFLLQVCLLLGLARSCGELLRHWGEPSLIGEILVGVLLGPTVLGHLAPGLPHALFPPDGLQYLMLETIAWLGIIFLTGHQQKTCNRTELHHIMRLSMVRYFL